MTQAQKSRDTLKWVRNRIKLKVIVNGDIDHPITFKAAMERYARAKFGATRYRAVKLGWNAEDTFYTLPTIVKSKSKIQRKEITDRFRLDIQRVTSTKWTFITERTYYEAH